MSEKKLLTNDKPAPAPGGQSAAVNKQIPRKKDGIIERRNSKVLTDDGKELLNEA